MGPRKRIPEEWAEILQPNIAYCITCQPYEGGEEVWIFGRRTSLDCLMDDLRVPEAVRDDVADRLHCFHCGRVSFDRWEDYGEKSEWEVEADHRWDEWHRRFEGQVDEFAVHLQTLPYLGLSHPIGRKIQSAIREFPKIDLERKPWWRARKPGGAKAFTSDDLRPPSPRHARAEGRFNHYGQSVFYLAVSPSRPPCGKLSISRKVKGLRGCSSLNLHSSVGS